MQARAALFLVTALFAAAPAAAQTHFEWPDTAVDVSTYTTLEECRAAVGRVRGAVRTREFHATHIWQDTTPLDPAEDLRAVPPEVGETARQCLGPFRDAHAAPVDDFRFLVPLYMLAGWDEQAHIIADRRFEGVADTTEEYAAVIDTLFEIYRGIGISDLSVGPTRVELMDELAATRVPDVSDRVRRLFLYWKSASGSMMEGRVDTLRVKRIAEKVLAIADSLEDDERRRVWEDATILGEGEEQADRLAGFFEYQLHTFLDSLSSSTEEYVRAKRNWWTRTTGQPPETYLLGMPIGETAPAIEADQWRGCDGECGVRPVPGQVNLIVFLSRNYCTGVPEDDSQVADRCARVLIPLRRMMERFPALEVTIVSRTAGHYTYLKDGITPEAEAEHTREWLEWFGVDAPVAVATTSSWRISEYDRRRVVRPVPNDENYSFGRTTHPDAFNAYLVDQAGLIVHVRQTNRHSEVQLSEMIEVLLNREKPRT